MSAYGNREPPGIEFEKRVFGLLRAVGYDVQRDEDVASRQTDVLARYSVLGHTFVLLVECKFKERGAVGVTDVEDFLNRVRNARHSGKADRGILVTNLSFTRASKALLSSHGAREIVQLATPESIIESHLPLDTYMNNLVQEFNGSDVASYYVPLGGTLTLPPDHAELERALMREEHMSPSSSDSTFDWNAMDHLALMLPEQRPRRCSNVEKYLLSWIDDDTSNLLCILGDYGTGKTTLCQSIAAHLAQQILSGDRKTKRIPLYMPLRNFYAAGSARALITDWIANECGVLNARYSLFLSMIEAGRFLLLLDGFDEMVKSTEQSRIGDCFRALAELNRVGGKTILSGRPGYFPDLNALNAIVAKLDTSAKWYFVRSSEPRIRSRVLFFFHAIRLHKLSLRQMNKIIENREDLITERGYTVAQLREKIKDLHHLSDLSQRPVLLDMIIKSFAAMGPRLFARNTAHLYEIYTSLWMEREREKGIVRQSVGPTTRRTCMLEVSWSMFVLGQEQLSDAELTELIQERVDIPADLTLEQLSNDTKTSTFLVPDRPGFWRYSHKSFLEYFAGVKVADAIERGGLDVLEVSALTLEVGRFVAEIVMERRDALTFLRDYISDRSIVGADDERLSVINLSQYSGEAQGIANALLILALCQGGTRDVPIRGLPIVRATFDAEVHLPARNMDRMFAFEARFSMLDISRCSGREVHWASVVVARLVGVGLVLRDCQLAEVIVSQAVLAGAQWTNVEMRRSNLAGADLRGATFMQCKFHDTVFGGAKVGDSAFVDCEFVGCDLRGVPLGRATLTGTRFRSCAGDEARFRNYDPKDTMPRGIDFTDG
jgi:Restriction endonuclease/NACHT domain/Pentapeptide repeats (8 copies)